MHFAHFSLLAIVYEAHAFNSCGILSILTSISTAGRSKVWSWNMCKWNKQWLSDSCRTPRQLVTGFLMKTRLRKSEGVKHITHTQKDQFSALEKELYRNYKKLRGQRLKRRAFGFRLNLVWWIQILTSNKLTKIKKVAQKPAEDKRGAIQQFHHMIGSVVTNSHYNKSPMWIRRHCHSHFRISRTSITLPWQVGAHRWRIQDIITSLSHHGAFSLNVKFTRQSYFSWM